MLPPLSDCINQVSIFCMSGRSLSRRCACARLIPAHMPKPCKGNSLACGPLRLLPVRL